MYRVWTSPGGFTPRLYLDMLRQTHLLIAGATGSGKSTVVNNIIQSAMLYNPSEIQFIFIDHKGTELAGMHSFPTQSPMHRRTRIVSKPWNKR